MRLSAHVNRYGIDAFTAEDFKFVCQKLSHEPDRLILVGGQALEIWGAILNVLAPTGDRHPLTADTDWLGGKRDAKWLCDQLGSHVELYLAGDFDSTPIKGYGLDPMLAVSDKVVDAIGGRFKTDDWPRTQQMVNRKRNRWLSCQPSITKPFA